MSTQTCSRCGAPIPQGHTVCPTCGAPAPKKHRYVRCSHCHRRVPAHLTVCPYCGRELKPWRPDKWVATFSILALLGLWLFFGNGFHTLGQAGRALVSLLPPRVTPITETVAQIPTATPTLPPTATPLPTVTSLPTFTPVPTATPTLAATATQTPTPAPSPTLATSSPTPATPTPQATATTTPTQTPTPTLTPSPTATATATASPTPTNTPPDVYIVQPGDTLSTIAQRVNRTIAALAAYNQIQDPTTIQVGQKLKIPPEDYVPPTPTPKRPTRTPTPTATPTPSITLPAPRLINPGDNAAYSGGNALIELQWEPLPGGLPVGAEYVVHVGVRVGPGPQDIEWRLVEPVGPNTTFYVPNWLFGQAPQPFGRAYPWYVQVGIVHRDGEQVQIIPISQPSEIRTFFWN